jgi:flavodoxin
MHQVLLYSRTGNTKLLANAIAEELGVKTSGLIAALVDPKAEIIFLGSGCYGSRPGDDMMKFIDNNDFSGRKVAVFGTSGGNMGIEGDRICQALEHKGATILGSYHCKGKAFLLFNLGHPDEEDLGGARKFAKEMANLG